MLFPSARRTIVTLFHTPLVPPTPGPPTFELKPIAGPSRPRAFSRTLSSVSTHGIYTAESRRAYASDRGKKELYSDEAGSVGAGTDDVAHTHAAFNKDANPQSAAKGVEKESGKNFTQDSPANPAQSTPLGKQGTDEGPHLGTSKQEAKK